MHRFNGMAPFVRRIFMNWNKTLDYVKETGIFALVWLVTVYLGVAITAFNDVPDDHFIHDAAGYKFVYKYILALGFAITAALAGARARWSTLGCRYGRSLRNDPWLIGDIAKTGLLVGGLTSATLAAVVAVFQQIVTDEKFLVPQSERLTDIAYLAIVLISLVILAAYLAARDQILKKPPRRDSNQASPSDP